MGYRDHEEVVFTWEDPACRGFRVSLTFHDQAVNDPYYVRVLLQDGEDEEERSCLITEQAAHEMIDALAAFLIRRASEKERGDG